MRTKLTILLSFIVFLTFSSYAAAVAGSGEPPKDDPFSLDEDAINQSMDRLSALEQYLLENEGTTLSDLEAANHPLVEDMNLSSNNSMIPLGVSADGPAGLPSFLWGFCLGAIGLLVVWLVTEDSDELKKSLWGFLTAIAVWAVVYLILWNNVQ